MQALLEPLTELADYQEIKRDRKKEKASYRSRDV